MDTLIYGADSETLRGQPMTLQFYSKMAGVSAIFDVNAKNSQSTFLKWCRSLRRNFQHVIYVHNLEFDLPEFLYGSLEHLALGDFDFEVGEWLISGVYGGPTFCRLQQKGRDILIVDSYSFFRGSLEKAAELFCPHLPKLKAPPNLGSVKYKSTDSAFAPYAMRDAEIAYYIGLSIQETVREYDIPQPVSVASLSSNIFRRHFVEHTIHQPPSRDIVSASLHAYHGGKNGWSGVPGWYAPVVSIDLKSAYPFAGTHLPAFSDPSLFRSIRVSPNARKVPTCGVYCIRAEVEDCHYPIVFDHGFKPAHGSLRDVWITGWELQEGLDSGEIELSGVTRGYIYDEDSDPIDSPFKRFFETFYKRKEGEKNKIQREKQKFVLNSLTGKLIETRKGRLAAAINADTGEVYSASDLVAGSLFHPFAAALITGHTRAYIHRLEHQISAIHTATDGLFAIDCAKTRRFKESRKLGAPSLEAKGELLMLRNKVYVLYAPKGSKEGFESPCFQGRRVLKYAKHGFQGTLRDLERIVITGDRNYTVQSPNKLKSSLKSGKQVNDFVTSTRRLQI